MKNPRQVGKLAAAVPLGADPDVRVFSPTKYRIMLMLKREEKSDLESLGKKLSISQMAVYKHIRDLEKKGLVEHEVRRGGVGRPRLVFRPSAKSSGVYPSAYSELATAALESLERKLGREAVEGVLRQLQTEIFAEYAVQVADGGLEDKVRRLATIRDSHGYMADVRSPSKGKVELIEHNCPISVVALKYPEVCEVERRTLEEVLGTKVLAVSTNPSGVTACKFQIAAK